MSDARRPLFIAMVGVLAIGCGDLTTAVGDEGRLEFALTTAYEVGGDLDEVKLVAGHPQTISVDLTPRGKGDIDEPEEITYRLEPRGGVTLTPEAAVSNRPRGFSVLVREPGAYKLRAVYKGKEIDSLDFSFDSPVSIDLLVRVREPRSTSLRQVQGATTTLSEGAQATFVPVPLDRNGDRLAGELQTDASADPEELVVPGQSVVQAYEDGVWKVRGPIELYFIDPGEVTVTILDRVSGAQGMHTFIVENVGD